MALLINPIHATFQSLDRYPFEFVVPDDGMSGGIAHLQTPMSAQLTAPTAISPRPRLSRSDGSPTFYPVASGLDFEQRVWVTSARAAIGLALMHAGLGAGDEVMLPAYHCRSMADPIDLLGLNLAYYRLDNRLRTSRSEIESRANKTTRAVVLTRFHGFVYDTSDIYEFCKEKGIVVIEDRAHAFFGSAGENADYVAYSVPKFFPVLEGGLLASRSRDLGQINTSAPPLAFQLKAALWPSEYTAQFDASYRPSRIIATLLRAKGLAKRVAAGLSANAAVPSSLGPAAADGGPGLERYWLDKSISAFSRRAVETADLGWISGCRRRNWQHLVASLARLEGIQLIEDQLQDQTVPYAVAFLVDRPDPAALAIKRRGIPLYRWNDFAIETTDESLRSTIDLSHRVFQIPTHQAMTESDIERIAIGIEAGLGEARQIR